MSLPNLRQSTPGPKKRYTPSSPSTSADCCQELFSPQGGGDDVVADCMDEATVGPLPLGALNISYDPFRVDSPYRPASPIFSPLGFVQPNRFHQANVAALMQGTGLEAILNVSSVQKPHRMLTSSTPLADVGPTVLNKRYPLHSALTSPHAVHWNIGETVPHLQRAISLLADETVDGLANEVGVAVVPGCFFDHVNDDPTH